jgi:hypothetical protein
MQQLPNLHQLVIGSTLVLFRCGSSAHQVAQRFMRRREPTPA